MKISPWVWLVVSIMMSLIVLSYAYFHKFAYNMEEANMLNKQAEALQTEAAKMPQARKKVEDARAEVAKLVDEWQQIVRVKTPPSNLRDGGIDLSVNPYQLTVDSRKYRDSLQRAVNRQVLRGGVKVEAGPRVPDPSVEPAQVMSGFFNYPAVPYPVVILELGQVEVTGTYQQITANVRSWASMPNYLAVASNLAIDGTGSTLHATYNVALVGYMRGQQISALLPDQIPAVQVPNQPGTKPNQPGTNAPTRPTDPSTNRDN